MTGSMRKRQQPTAAAKTHMQCHSQPNSTLSSQTPMIGFVKRFSPGNDRAWFHFTGSFP